MDNQFLTLLLFKICEKIVEDFKPKNSDGTPVIPLDIAKRISQIVFVIDVKIELLEHEIVVKNYLEPLFRNRKIRNQPQRKVLYHYIS